MSASEGAGRRLVVRRAGEADLPAVWAIEQVSFPTPWSRSLLATELRREKSLYLAAEIDGELIGYVGMWLSVGEGHVCTLAVDPEWRGRGVAEALMLCVLERAVALNARLVVLEHRTGNAAAAGLYDKLGFIQVGRRKGYYHDTGEDAIVMAVGGLGHPDFTAELMRAREQWEQERDLELEADL